jgi:hypothetical protein
MKPPILAAALTLGLASAAHAQEPPVVRPVVGTGITYGGETLAEVEFTSGRREKIKSGGLFTIYGGVEFRLGDLVDLQATVGYHVDDTSYADNGGLRFSRHPVDVIALFRVAPRVRLGVGVQHVNSAKLAGSGDLSFIGTDYRSATGGLVEAEYLFWPNFGIKGRAVSIRYRPENGGQSVDGSHLGVMVNYYFF